MATKTDDYKVVIHFPDHDENYRTKNEYECSVREFAERICASTSGASWSIYRALSEPYMGQGPIGPDGYRTPCWVYPVIGWCAIKTTRVYRNMEQGAIT